MEAHKQRIQTRQDMHSGQNMRNSTISPAFVEPIVVEVTQSRHKKIALVPGRFTRCVGTSAWFLTSHQKLQMESVIAKA
jgi:hypothetical protein